MTCEAHSVTFLISPIDSIGLTQNITIPRGIMAMRLQYCVLLARQCVSPAQLHADYPVDYSVTRSDGQGLKYHNPSPTGSTATSNSTTE